MGRLLARGVTWACVVMVLAFGVSLEAEAQGFQVRPLTVDGAVPPGRQVRIPIEIAGTSGDAARVLEIRLAQLEQEADGSLLSVRYSDGDAVLPNSLAPWITIPDQIEIQPRSVNFLDVLVDVPISARGTYVGAIIVEAPNEDQTQGLNLTVRVLIPIYLAIEGRPVRQEISLAGAAIAYPDLPEEASGAKPETTLVKAQIVNAGGTMSRIRGDLWVDYLDDSGKWKQIQRVALEERRVLPATTLDLPLDLERLLPGGNYRVRGELYSDGRRTKPLRQELSFEGHPDVAGLVTDLDLSFDPSVFVYEYRAGARRTGKVEITNPGLDPIEVSISVDLPDAMKGRAGPAFKGADISAASWVSVKPETFRLRPGQKRNLRLLAQFPDEAAAQQNYYAALSLEGAYLDGQRAGSSVGLVEVTNPENENAPAALITAATVTEGEEGYVLSLRSVNVGDVLVSPSAGYVLFDSAGNRALEGELPSGLDAPLLPLVERSFGGALSTEGLAPGAYELLFLLRLGGVEAANVAKPVTVTEEGGLTLGEG